MTTNEPDEVVLVDSNYWAEHPYELAAVLKDLTGVDAPTIASQHYGLKRVMHLIRIPLERVADILLPQFQTSLRPVQASDRLTFSVEEAADLLGISRSLAYESVQRGEIPSVRFGKRIVIPKAALLRMLEERGDEQDEPQPA